ncbi:WxL domain-containing protein [Enterococcus hirae]|uniref:adhesive domain-containing protein n=1 Tax=Enterococcus hirae TaxID=1354 RepID=UPI00289075DD|nr:adhesive domain-containing protein [Enterococcus hirae]MDT2650317.1 WxL domain-containing protein [Enterococcus hirae]
MLHKKRKQIQQVIFLLLTLLSVLAQTNVVQAVSLNLFGTTTATNNSQTSPNAPFLNRVNVPVTFLIEGKNGISAGVIITGDKYAILEAPTEMVGYIQPNGNATVQTTVTVPLSQSPLQLILPTITSVISLIVNSPLVSTQNKTAVNQALSELRSETFGAQNLTLAIVPRSSTQYGVAISQGLLPILTTTLKNRIQNLLTIVQALPLIGTVLGTLLSPFVTALSQFITSLNSPTSDNSKNLVAASILGNTSVSLPFLLSSPKLTQDLTANFKGGFIQTDQSTIQLGPTTGTTPVYFSAGALTWQTTSLPTHLNFGQHLIQTQQDEHLVATNNNQVTTGSISITDTRTVVKNWQIKVQQLSPWQNGTNQLTSQLQISTADLTTTFPITGITSTANQMVPLSIGTQQTLLKLNGVTDPGQVQLAINQFSLAVPKESLKTKGTYQTMVEWLLSDTP